MREPGSRSIDISRAKRVHTAGATRAFTPVGPRQAAAPARPVPAEPAERPAPPAAASARPPQLTTGDPTQTVVLPADHPSLRGKARAREEEETQVSGGGATAGRRGKGKRAPRRIITAAAVTLLALVLLLTGGAYLYISRIFDPSAEGGGGQLTHTETLTPPELAESQINFLVLGLDYMDDAAQRSEDTMMTDMILYCQFDRDAQTLKMLQVPRDAFVERPEDTAGTGKINALYSFGPDSENKVQNLVDVFYDTFQLPVDYYITIQMDALVEFVNTFGGGGGFEVYIPQDIYIYDANGAQVYNEDGTPAMLEHGWRTLRGEELEIFLRARKGPGLERSDFDRLNNQRYFYSALFRYMRTMSVSEMMRLVPVCAEYVNTNMPITTCIALGLQFLGGGVPDENIIIGRVPMYGNGVYYTGGGLAEAPQVSIIAAQQTADLLNEYFRPADAPVDVSELDIRTTGDMASWGGVVEAEMSHMGADGQVEDGAALPGSEAAQDAVSSEAALSAAADGAAAVSAPAA